MSELASNEAGWDRLMSELASNEAGWDRLTVFLFLLPSTMTLCTRFY
jgi:hypothetical protein